MSATLPTDVISRARQSTGISFDSIFRMVVDVLETNGIRDGPFGN